MKNKFAEMWEDENFRKFFEHILGTANFFVALNCDGEDRKNAVAICLAYAYEAGKKSEGK